jgi:uncharacterized protein involved in type VI secretion and phage assembly
MNESLYNTLRQIIQDELRHIRTAELALVQEQHPHEDESDTDNYACTVALRDSGIVLKKVPLTTSLIGQAAIPNVGDLVLVQFLGGDINGPIITGRLYNDEDRPPPNHDQGLTLNLPAASAEDGILIDLQGSDRSLRFSLGAGLLVTLKDDDPVIEIEVDSGSATLTIQRDGTLNIASQSDLKIEANNIDISAGGEMTLKGSTINLN